jgi:hypothetical protein
LAGDWFGDGVRFTFGACWLPVSAGGDRGRGPLILRYGLSHRDVDELTRATPRTAAAWTSDGTSHEHRGLKHLPEHAIRTVPIPPELVTLLSNHLARYGTAADGRLFAGRHGGILSESAYGRAWHRARTRRQGCGRLMPRS